MVGAMYTALQSGTRLKPSNTSFYFTQISIPTDFVIIYCHIPLVNNFVFSQTFFRFERVRIHLFVKNNMSF